MKRRKLGHNSLSYRLGYAMQYRGMIGADITRKAEEYGVRLGSSTISQYLSGKYAPKQDKIVILSKILGVPELWLMGLTPIEDIEGYGQEQCANPVELEILEIFRSLNKDGKELMLRLARTIDRAWEYKKACNPKK